MDFNNQYQLLQEVYRGAKMGDISIRLLLPKVDNARFRSDLQTQFRQYQATASNAENQMKAMGRCPKEVTNGKYALLWLSLQGNTLCNRETSHLAEMMIQAAAWASSPDQGVESLRPTHPGRHPAGRCASHAAGTAGAGLSSCHHSGRGGQHHPSEGLSAITLLFFSTVSCTLSNRTRRVRPMTKEERYMTQALALAGHAAAAEDIPVGCVVVKDGAVIGQGYNRRVAGADATAHAELEAIRAACAQVGSWRLDGCELYVTLEPCPMCAGAMTNAASARWYGAKNSKARCCGSVLVVSGGSTTVLWFYGGVLGAECAKVLHNFFRGCGKENI